MLDYHGVYHSVYYCSVYYYSIYLSTTTVSTTTVSTTTLSDYLWSEHSSTINSKFTRRSKRARKKHLDICSLAKTLVHSFQGIFNTKYSKQSVQGCGNYILETTLTRSTQKPSNYHHKKHKSEPENEGVKCIGSVLVRGHHRRAQCITTTVRKTVFL